MQQMRKHINKFKQIRNASNEQMHKSTNEPITNANNKSANDQINKWTNQQITNNKQMNTCKQIHQQIITNTNKLTNQPTNKQPNKQMNWTNTTNK